MGDKSAIEWTDATWNPVTGCTKVSQGCKNCYAERVFPRPYPGRKFTDVQTHPDRLEQPLRWKKPRRIFVNSMSDLFHEDVPNEFIFDVFTIMARAHWHTFQVLTKRPERMAELVAEPVEDGEEPPPRNIWWGVSVEDQATADERIPLLQQTPAAIRFLSCEPLLGNMNIERYLVRKNVGGPGEATTYGVDWVIAGGESGPKARPSHPDWFRSLRDQCAAAGVPYFFKQWGEFAIANLGNIDAAREDFFLGRDGGNETDRPIDQYSDGCEHMVRIGKKAAGRVLDGRTHDEYPA